MRDFPAASVDHKRNLAEHVKRQTDRQGNSRLLAYRRQILEHRKYQKIPADAGGHQEPEAPCGSRLLFSGKRRLCSRCLHARLLQRSAFLRGCRSALQAVRLHADHIIPKDCTENNKKRPQPEHAVKPDRHAGHEILRQPEMPSVIQAKPAGKKKRQKDQQKKIRIKDHIYYQMETSV